MALGYSLAIRNARLLAVKAAIDVGAAGKLRIYSGTRPATGAAITSQVLLAELTFSDPCAPDPTTGVLVFSAITPDSAANATGVATWARVLSSTDVFCIDGSVGVSGADFNFPSVNFEINTEVSVPTAQITAGNA